MRSKGACGECRRSWTLMEELEKDAEKTRKDREALDTWAALEQSDNDQEDAGARCGTPLPVECAREKSSTRNGVPRSNFMRRRRQVESRRQVSRERRGGRGPGTEAGGRLPLL